MPTHDNRSATEAPLKGGLWCPPFPPSPQYSTFTCQIYNAFRFAAVPGEAVRRFDSQQDGSHRNSQTSGKQPLPTQPPPSPADRDVGASAVPEAGSCLNPAQPLRLDSRQEGSQRVSQTSEKGPPAIQQRILAPPEGLATAPGSGVCGAWHDAAEVGDAVCLQLSQAEVSLSSQTIQQNTDRVCAYHSAKL